MQTSAAFTAAPTPVATWPTKASSLASSMSVTCISDHAALEVGVPARVPPLGRGFVRAPVGHGVELRLELVQAGGAVLARRARLGPPGRAEGGGGDDAGEREPPAGTG